MYSTEKLRRLVAVIQLARNSAEGTPAHRLYLKEIYRLADEPDDGVPRVTLDVTRPRRRGVKVRSPYVMQRIAEIKESENA